MATGIKRMDRKEKINSSNNNARHSKKITKVEVVVVEVMIMVLVSHVSTAS